MDIKVAVEAFRPYVQRKSQEKLDTFLANLKKPEDGWNLWRERRTACPTGGLERAGLTVFCGLRFRNRERVDPKPIRSPYTG
jgi:hypothetical protein